MSDRTLAHGMTGVFSNRPTGRGDILNCPMRTKSAQFVLALMCLLGQALMVGIPPGSAWCLGCEDAAPERTPVPNDSACCCCAPRDSVDRARLADSRPCPAMEHNPGGGSSNRCCLQLSSHSDPQRLEPRQSIDDQIRLLIVSLPVVFFDRAALIPAEPSASDWLARKPHCEQTGITTTRLLI